MREKSICIRFHVCYSLIRPSYSPCCKMTDKKQYIQLCRENSKLASIPVFSQSYWLDQVAENWDVCLFRKEEKIVAALPYCWKGRLLTKRIYLPDSSFYQSILFFEKCSDAERQKIAERLFEQLPKTIKSYFKFLPEYNAIDLSGLSYTKEIYFTYLLTPDDTTPLLSTNHRRNIRKGIKNNYTIQASNNIALSYALLVSTFSRQKLTSKTNLEAFQSLAERAKEHQCGQVLNCLDDKKNVLASVFVAEDVTTVYYLMGGYNHDFKNSGAMTYLLNHVIQQAISSHKVFNFCGSSKKTIATFFEGFGATRYPLNIWKKILKL